MAGGQLFGVSSLGGNYAAFNLSKELRMGVKPLAKFRQFCDIKDAWSQMARSGQTFTWDVVPTISRASRALTETNTIPQVNHTILQGTLTLNERGVSVPYTQLLENLAMVSVRKPIMDNLKVDAACDLDALAHQQFNATPLRVVSTNSADTAFTLTTNSSATATNTTLLSKINVRAIVDGMKGRNIPSYTASDYYCISSPGGLRLLKNDMEGIHQYTPEGLTMIKAGEIGRYETTRFVEQTNIPTGGAADATTFDPFTNTGQAWQATGAGDWAFFFGSDTVCEGIHTPEEIRIKRSDDYDRAKGIAWFALLGYAITHTNAVQARVVKYDSAH